MKLYGLLALLMLVCSSANGTDSPDVTPPVIRIMPLGDSLTAGAYVEPDGTFKTGAGYRQTLWQDLANAHYNVQFVGANRDGPADFLEQNHEGHSGRRIDEISAGADQWVRAANPDVVLLLIGGNDAIQDYDHNPKHGNTTAIDRLSALVDKIEKAAPNAKIIVSTTTSHANPDVETRVEQYNKDLTQWTTNRGKTDLHVYFVDMYALAGIHNGLNGTQSDLYDGVHPKPGGYQTMGHVWFAALQGILPSPQSGIYPSTSYPSPQPSSDSFAACRSQLPRGPYSFSTDGKSLDIASSLDVASGKDYQIDGSNPDQGTVDYETVFQGTANQKFSVHVSKDTSGRIVAAEAFYTLPPPSGIKASSTLEDVRYTFLPNDQNNQCVLQHVVFHTKTDQTLFDLDFCKQALDFIAQHPDVTQCDSLRGSWDPSQLGYGQLEKTLRHAPVIQDFGNVVAVMGGNFNDCTQFYDQYKSLQENAGQECTSLRGKYTVKYFTDHPQISPGNTQYGVPSASVVGVPQ